ncbi:uncharacterized protein PFL1_01768 [Pseudozyma flocculosa PF-1]|uniref:uncharacterized protein n=1 Tax=Pseudozyma flocculosa PF-1 TaxID=1277687 RepID=UPI0004560CB1|nr:uncharacterized protein PFL1_01768 [Pseudozyma flocculosa PF-1]EPQ30871.1 hypothetical protein PFL1_01768 [Pseudozyma flocculosa PF-1]
MPTALDISILRTPVDRQRASHSRHGGERGTIGRLSSDRSGASHRLGRLASCYRSSVVGGRRFRAHNDRRAVRGDSGHSMHGSTAWKGHSSCASGEVRRRSGVGQASISLMGYSASQRVVGVDIPAPRSLYGSTADAEPGP